MNTTKIAYIISLNNLINEKKNELLLLSNSFLNGNTQYCLFEAIKRIKELQTLVKKLDFDLELLKKYAIDLDYRVDFEQRRRIGNLLAEKILSLFPNNIEPMKKNEFFLSLSIENIEEKINKLNSSKEKVEKEKLSELREKLNKALNFLKELTVTKLEEINKSDYDITKFKLDKPSIIQFIKNEKDTNNEIAIILNLYFIIRKNLNEFMNKSIHNKSVKINLINIF